MPSRAPFIIIYVFIQCSFACAHCFRQYIFRRTAGVKTIQAAPSQTTAHCLHFPSGATCWLWLNPPSLCSSRPPILSPLLSTSSPSPKSWPNFVVILLEHPLHQLLPRVEPSACISYHRYIWTLYHAIETCLDYCARVTWTVGKVQDISKPRNNKYLHPKTERLCKRMQESLFNGLVIFLQN